jgi:hypothetical protein
VYVGIGTYGERKVSVVLEQDCHRTSKVGQPQCLDIMSIDEYTPLCGVKYTSSKLEDCAFPGSIRANYNLRCDVTQKEINFMPPRGREDARKVGLVKP